MVDQFKSSEIVEYPKVVWLCSPTYRQTEQATTLQEQLSDIVQCVHISTSINNCEELLRGSRQFSDQHHIFLIVNDEYIDAIVAKCLDQMRAVRAVFIVVDQGLPSDFRPEQCAKLNGIYADRTDLLMKLFSSVEFFSTRSAMLLSTLAAADAHSTTNIVNNFADYAELSFPLFVDLLLDLPPLSGAEHRQHLEDFVEQCRRFYAGNKSKLAEIDSFVSPTTGYTPSTAVQQYTAESFLYKQVNKVLRQRNIEGIFILRFFLTDIYAQLNTLYPKPNDRFKIDQSIQLYRGQQMFQHELDALQEKRTDGSLITVNSYFSTSLDDDVPMILAETANTTLKAVLFVIEVKYRAPATLRRKPFAAISELSRFESEREVLFAVGSKFRLTHDIQYNANRNCYIVRMAYVYDDDDTFIITKDYAQLSQCSPEVKLLRVGDLLFNGGGRDAIKTSAFYREFLNGNYLPSIRAASFAGLGWLAFKTNQPDEANAWQGKALKLYPALPDEPYRKYLFATSYNCLAAVARQRNQYERALDYYKQAYAYDRGVIPIDKYDFYHSFVNVPAVNIAILQNLLGFPDRAWLTFQEMVTRQMQHCDRLRAPAYVKIVEASFLDALAPANEHRLRAWETFLDLSFKDVSASYRHSIVSGTFSLSSRMTNKPETRDKAVIYYEKIIAVCQRFGNLTADDNAVVIQARLELAQLYKQQRLFKRAMEQAVIGLELCKTADVQGWYEMVGGQGWTTCYQLLKEIYQQQLEESLILVPSDAYQFEWSEFSFGQYRKILDPALLQNSDLRQCVTYCCLKLAALTHQVDASPSKRTMEFLHQASTTSPDNRVVKDICRNNTLYANNDFDRLIAFYQLELSERSCSKDNQHQCIDEVAFSYIAHLYERKLNTKQAEHWYINAINHFKERGFVCSHTLSCFTYAADFYTRNGNTSAVASIYRELVHHLLDFHHESSVLQRSIVDIVESVFVSLAISTSQIYQHFVQLALKEPDDAIGMDEEFRHVVSVCKEATDYPKALADGYDQYLKVLLSPEQRFVTDHIDEIRATFEKAIDVYRRAADPLGVTKICQLFTDVIIRHAGSCERLIDAVKTLGFELERSKQNDTALVVYDALERFVRRFHSRDCLFDDGVINFLLDRYRILGHEQTDRTIALYKKIIEALRTFKAQPNRYYDMNVYLDRLERYYMDLAVLEPGSAPETYSSLLELFFAHRPERFERHLVHVTDALRQRPRDLLTILMRFRIDCTALIRQVHERFLQSNNHPTKFEPLTACGWTYIDTTASSFIKKARRLAMSGRSDEVIEQCFRDCLYFLLESKSVDDERLADCQSQLGDLVSAMAVFDGSIYNELAPRFCQSASRRYLKHVSRSTGMKSDES